MNWSPQESARYELELRDSRALSYDLEYARLHGPFFPAVEMSIIRRGLDLTRQDVLLDLGCGTGRLTEQLAPLTEHVIAVDRSGRSLDVLRDRLAQRSLANVTIVQADVARDLPIDQRVSKVLGVQLLQHLPTSHDRLSVLRSAAELLERGGRCLVIDEVFNLVRRVRGKARELARPDSLFFHTFTPREMRDTVNKAGLRPIQYMGCGIFYWTGYRLAPEILTRLDQWGSPLPGAWLISKFGATVAVKD